MDTITSLRLRINGINNALLTIFFERFKLTEKVAKYKHSKGLPTYDPERERQILSDLERDAREVGGIAFATAMREIFQKIMASSRALQDIERGKQPYHFDAFGKYYCNRCDWKTPGIPGPLGSTGPICPRCKEFLIPQ